jgi:hypothetical protein
MCISRPVECRVFEGEAARHDARTSGFSDRLHATSERLAGDLEVVLVVAAEIERSVL